MLFFELISGSSLNKLYKWARHRVSVLTDFLFSVALSNFILSYRRSPTVTIVGSVWHIPWILSHQNLARIFILNSSIIFTLAIGWINIIGKRVIFLLESLLQFLWWQLMHHWWKRVDFKMTGKTKKCPSHLKWKCHYFSIPSICLLQLQSLSY